MELYQLLIQAGTGAIALYILYQFQRNVAAENTRKDEAMKQERDRSQQNHQEFMLLYAQNTTMLATLAGKQVDTAAAVTSVEKSVGARVEGSEQRVSEKMDVATHTILEGLGDVKAFVNDIFDMYMKDPRASAEQIRRFMAATKEGDAQKAKDISAEPGEGASKVDTDISAAPDEGKAA